MFILFIYEGGGKWGRHLLSTMTRPNAVHIPTADIPGKRTW